MTSKSTFPFMLAFLLFSCQKESTYPNGEPSPKQYATLEVSVALCEPGEDPFCEKATPVSGAKVFLYDSELARDAQVNFVDNGTTGSGGKIVWATLELPEYWLTIQMPSPDGRTQKEFSRTPLRTTTYLPVIFEK